METREVIPGPKYPRGVGRTRVAELTDKGFSARDIARILDISRAAVYQHRKANREREESE